MSTLKAAQESMLLGWDSRHGWCKFYTKERGVGDFRGSGRIQGHFRYFPSLSFCQMRLTTMQVLQFRLGGIKGVLVAYPDDHFEALCTKYKPGCGSHKLKIAYCGTMLKHEGGPRDIEANRVSQDPTPARINHGFIVLLLTLDRKLIKVCALL